MNWKEKWTNLKSKLKTIKNFEIMVAIVIIAVVILIYSNVGNLGKKESTTSGTEVEYSQLEMVLSSIEGAGKVRVLTSKEAIADGTEKITGVIVVAEGAEDIKVRMELIRAVSRALNVDANAIEIFAMK